MRRVSQPILRVFGQAIFVAAGSSSAEADIVASHLVEASLIGHDSHRMMRIPKYVDWVRAAKFGRTSTRRWSPIAARSSLPTAIMVLAKSSAARRWRSRPPRANSRYGDDCDPQFGPSRAHRGVAGDARRTGARLRSLC